MKEQTEKQQPKMQSGADASQQGQGQTPPHAQPTTAHQSGQSAQEQSPSTMQGGGQRSGQSSKPNGQHSTQPAKTNGGHTGQQRGLSTRDWSMPAFARENPFAMMRRFSDEMDRFMERMFGNLGFGRGGLGSLMGRGGQEMESLWSPQIEVCEHDNQLIVCADLPGMKKDDIKVEFTDEALILQGERHHEHEDTQQGYHRSERSYGSFYRSIPLPEGVSPDNAQATFQDGVLRITIPMPQQEKSRSRRIEIQSGAQPTSGQQGSTSTGKSSSSSSHSAA